MKIVYNLDKNDLIDMLAKAFKTDRNSVYIYTVE